MYGKEFFRTMVFEKEYWNKAILERIQEEFWSNFETIVFGEEFWSKGILERLYLGENF